MGGFNPADYVDVQERINRFWSEYPEGSIVTELNPLDEEGKRVTVMASVWKLRPQSDIVPPDVTGIAMEVEGSSNVNRTSHIENCETSAIGRALANMGYAKTGKDRPSRQEMEKAQAGGEAAPHGKKAGTKPADDPMELTIPSGKLKGKKIGDLNLEEAESLIAFKGIPAESDFGKAVRFRADTLKKLANAPEAVKAANGELDLEAAK